MRLVLGLISTFNKTVAVMQDRDSGRVFKVSRSSIDPSMLRVPVPWPVVLDAPAMIIAELEEELRKQVSISRNAMLADVVGVALVYTGALNKLRAEFLKQVIRGAQWTSDGPSFVGPETQALAHAFSQGHPTVAFAAGTNAVAYYTVSDAVGTFHGGHGPIIDGAGGGFWIGTELLRRIAGDGNSQQIQSDAPIVRKLLDYLRVSSVDELLQWTSALQWVSNPGMRTIRSEISDLAIFVNSVWEEHQDPHAQQILADASAHLVNKVLQCIHGEATPSSDTRTLACFCGGLLRNSKYIGELVQQGVSKSLPDACFLTPSSQGLTGVELAALKLAAR